MEHRALDDNHFFIRVDRGEEVIATLTDFCSHRKITAARLSAIGAVRDAELGYYDLGSFTYLTKKLSGIFELVSLQGNVALLEGGNPFVHAHATLGGPDLTLQGGHLMKATVAVTVEAFLTVFPETLERGMDPEVRLNLMR